MATGRDRIKYNHVQRQADKSEEIIQFVTFTYMFLKICKLTKLSASVAVTVMMEVPLPTEEVMARE